MEDFSKDELKLVEVTFTNDGFGGRCCLCGTRFEDDFCSHGHEQGSSFTKKITQRQYNELLKKQAEAENKKDNSVEDEDSTFVICEVFSGCRCTVCGGFFEEGGDICSLGRHQIGQSYPREN